MRIAVIDLGTNTCNLLIAEINEANYKILHQSKQLVRLGDNKIKKNEISYEAINRTLQAFSEHKKIIQSYQVDVVKCFATSAVRSAANKINFLDKIGNETGYLVKVIPGETEADLIFKGVLLAFENILDPTVILDIGGGSNELIFCTENNLLWKESKATGMSRIINQFTITDPILPIEIETLRNFFAEQHSKSILKGRTTGVKTLIGCSGAFDTIADIIDSVYPGEKQRKTQIIKIKHFYDVFKKLVASTREERLQMKGMDFVRVDLIVPAVILIELIISRINITHIVQTDFALREGVIYEIMNKEIAVKA